MNKSTKHEPTPTDTPKPSPQSKRYDEAFKQQAVVSEPQPCGRKRRMDINGHES